MSSSLEKLRLPKPEAIRAAICQRSLRDFIREAWHVVEPATPFVPSWHIDAICDHLEAATRGEIRRLIINIPPRHMKSLAVSVFWPAWVWATRPESRWLFASYAESLSMRDSIKCRDVIQSPWYRARWGNVVQLSGDQNVKSRFKNSAQGYRLATSTGGAILGEGGDFIVIDDPHNVREVESEDVRQGVLDWWDTGMSTRSNDPKRGVFCVIMQRLHQKDLTGHLLAKGGWTHLKIPAEFDGQRKKTILGWEDPRKKPGELLWPDRFGKPELDELKASLGTYGSAGQLQQEPVPPGGGIIKKSWFRYYRWERAGEVLRLGTNGPIVRVDELYRFLTVDPALTEDEEADYTCIASWGIVRQRPTLLVMLDLTRERMEGPGILPAIDAMRQKWKPAYTAFEAIAFQRAIFQQAKREGRAFREVSTSLDALVRIDKDKVARTYAASPFIEQGRLWLPAPCPAASWVPEYEIELTGFPKAEHDDQVDVTTVAVAIAQTHQPLVTAPPPQKERKSSEDDDHEDDKDLQREDEDDGPVRRVMRNW